MRDGHLKRLYEPLLLQQLKPLCRFIVVSTFRQSENYQACKSLRLRWSIASFLYQKRPFRPANDRSVFKETERGLPIAQTQTNETARQIMERLRLIECHHPAQHRICHFKIARDVKEEPIRCLGHGQGLQGQRPKHPLDRL